MTSTGMYICNLAEADGVAYLAEFGTTEDGGGYFRQVARLFNGEAVD